MKWLRRGLFGLLGLVVLAGVVVGAAAWLLLTEGGASWLAEQALARAAPTVTVGRVSGTLLGGLVFEDVRIRGSRDELDLARLDLEWSAPAALAGTLAFTRAGATTVAYRRLAGADTDGGAAFELPFPVRVDAASVAALTVTVGEQTLEFRDGRSAARFAGRRLVLEQVAAAIGGFALTGAATVTLAEDVELAADVQWTGPLAGVAAAGRGSVAGTWPELRVSHELTLPFAATADGSLTFVDEPSFDLVVAWQDLAWPTAPLIASPSGRMTLTGTLADYRYDGAGTVDVDGRAAEFTAQGAGAFGELTFERVDLLPRTAQGGAGTLRADGELSLGTRTVRLAVAASDFDPGWVVAAWPGRLTGGAQLRAALTPGLTAELSGAELRGELRRYPVTLTGAAAFTTPNAWQLSALRLDSAPNFVLLDGMLDDDGLDLAVSAELEQLDLLLPGVGGALEGSVAVSGTWREPHARGRFVARSLTAAGVTAEQLDVSGEAGLAPSAPLALAITAQGVTRGAVTATELEATLAGTTAAHRLDLRISAEQWQATTVASGGLAQSLWQGSLERFELDEQLLGPWRLEAPAQLAFGVARVGLANSCLLHASGGRWCAELDLRGRVEDRLVVAAQNVDLSTLRPLLPPALTIDGVYQLSASLFDLTGEPRGALVVSGGVTRVRVAFGAEQAFATELDELRAGVTLTAGLLDAQASVRSTVGGSAELRARIDDVRRDDSPLDAALRLAWPDLGFLALLSPELSGVGGALAADVAIRGTVDTPTVDGEATWSDGRVALPEWGLVVEGIAATAVSRNGRTLAFDATGRAGDGLLTLTGATELDADAGWPTRLRLRGEAVRIVQLADAEIVATPDLTLDVALPEVKVSGTVQVPRAALTLSELPAQAVATSRDAVLHGREGEQVQRLQLRTDIELTLGDDVRYDALNLETKVTGQLRLITEPDRSATATGTLTLTGTYNAYGQPLQLERGQLLFSGPLDDPGLDVRAVRVIDATRVGVELAGTIKAPLTRVFSAPAMSEADALSYLLLGRPVTGSGVEETSTLQTAAISMGLQQALPVVQRIGTSLGLDELSVQTTDTDAGALMAGKYLSPKLYIRYSYGLFNRIGGLLLRFRVNERLSIETRSGDQKSMDLLYTVEKD